MNFNQQQIDKFNSPTRNLYDNSCNEGVMTPQFQNASNIQPLQQNNQLFCQQQQNHNPYQMNPQQQLYPNQQFSNQQGNNKQQFQFPNNNIFQNENMLTTQMMYMNQQQNLYNQQSNPSYQNNNQFNNHNQQQNQIFPNNNCFNYGQQQTQNNSRHKKNKTTNESILQKKLWFSVTIEFCSLNRELEGKLNSYFSQHSIVRDIKFDLLQQLHNMGKLQAHQLNDYISFSRVLYNGNPINDGLSLEQMLKTTEPQLPVECKLQLAKCKVKLTKRDYHTFPKISDLLAADEDYLSQVEDFQITNGLGTIMWPGKTDLRFLDLDEIINITQFDVEVYSNLPTLMKPKVGEKLNKNCFSEFRISYDVLSRDWGCQTDHDIACFLSRKFEEKQMMFINDDSSNKTVIFGKEISHFSTNDFFQKQV